MNWVRIQRILCALCAISAGFALKIFIKILSQSGERFFLYRRGPRGRAKGVEGVGFFINAKNDI